MNTLVVWLSILSVLFVFYSFSLAVFEYLGIKYDLLPDDWSIKDQVINYFPGCVGIIFLLIVAANTMFYSLDIFGWLIMFVSLGVTTIYVWDLITCPPESSEQKTSS